MKGGFMRKGMSSARCMREDVSRAIGFQAYPDAA